MEVLLPVDVEAAVIAELSAALPLRGWPGLTVAESRVGTKIPGGSKPESFVRVYSVGGLSRDLVSDSPTLVVEGYHRREQGAFDLCSMSVALLEAAGRAGRVGVETCYGVTVAGLPGNLPDPNVPDMYRFTSTVALDLRRNVI